MMLMLMLTDITVKLNTWIPDLRLDFFFVFILIIYNRLNQMFFFLLPAFYTSKYGYKMCLRIYLNGDGTGRGSHLSLFFVVMRGQSDALLKWPFNQKVKDLQTAFSHLHKGIFVF